MHPFDDRVVIAGQATVGLELAADAPDVTDVLVSIGGGGLIAGVATVFRAVAPGVRIWGVVICGGNVTAADVAGWVARFGAAAA